MLGTRCILMSPNTNQNPRFVSLQVQRGDLDLNFVVLLFKRMEIVYFHISYPLIILKEVLLPLQSSISRLQRLRRLLRSLLNMQLVSTSQTNTFVSAFSLKTVRCSSI